MQFVNRESEQERLKSRLQSGMTSFIVIDRTILRRHWYCWKRINSLIPRMRRYATLRHCDIWHATCRDVACYVSMRELAKQPLKIWLMAIIKKIWNDAVWSKVISTSIISLGAIIYAFVRAKFDELSFWDVLTKTLVSPYFLCLVILILFIYILFDKLKKPKKDKISHTNSEGHYTWTDVENGVKSIREKLIMDNYIPSLLVGIGRGGAIVSSLLSGNMLTGRHIPFIALERKYN